MSKIVDLTGRRFGRWLVLEFARRENRRTMFRCLCDCGTAREVGALSLTRKSRPSESCGCKAREASRASTSGVVHGEARRFARSREYRIWKNMRNRCLNPQSQDFAQYGGRGITICARWDEFSAFLADMGRAPTGRTLDRKNVNGGYEPTNCRWATQTTQQRNRTNNKLDEFKAGEIRLRYSCGESSRALAKSYGVSRKMVMLVVKRLAWVPEPRPEQPSLLSWGAP